VNNILFSFILFPEIRHNFRAFSPIGATKMGIYFLMFYTKAKKYFCLLKAIIRFFFFTRFPKKKFREFSYQGGYGLFSELYNHSLFYKK